MQTRLLSNGIEVLIQGNIEHKAIVFIHGNSLDASVFSEQFNQLGSIPLVAITLQGHGRSKRSKDPENDYCLPGFVRTVKETINELNVGSFILAGHSLGGHIAIESIREVDGLKGLFVFGTPPIGMLPQMEEMFLPNPNVGLLFTENLTEEQLENIAKEMVYNNTALANRLKDIISQTDPAFRKFMGQSVGAGKFKNERSLLSGSDLPFVIANGKKDSMVNTAYCSAITTNITKLQTHVLFEESGHTPQLEVPEEFNKTLTNFYRTVFN